MNLDNKIQVKWYFRISTVVLAFGCVGPLALPLIWFHPQLSKAKKISITILTVILTYVLFKMLVGTFNRLTSSLRQQGLIF